jgi:hypothetical protein
MLDRLNLQFQDVSVRDWKLLISLLVTANMVTMTSLGWLVLSWISMPNIVRDRVMAQAPVTRTPMPTFTRTPIVTPSPTYTRVPTWTPSPTATPTVTPVPPPTDTPPPKPTRAQVKAQSPKPTATPTPAHDFVATVRQLTPCENEGKHHLFIYVKDRNGQGIPDVRMRVSWPSGEAFAKTGNKLEVDPGFTDFAMFKGSYTVQLADLDGETVGPLTPDIPRNELCDKTGNPVANSFFHYSYEIIFQQVR